MTEQPRVTARIETDGELTVDAIPPTETVARIVIRNNGDALERIGGECDFGLVGYLGQDERALFRDENDALKCRTTAPPGWSAKWRFFESVEREQRFELVIHNTRFDDILLEKDESFTVSLAGILSRTESGVAELIFRTFIGEDAQPLTLMKTSGDPGIVSFTSDPQEGNLNLPGDTVTLRWRIYKLTDPALILDNLAEPLSCDFDKDRGEKKICCGDIDMNFVLKGYAGNRPMSRALTVRVLRSGWYDVRHRLFKGEPGYPTDAAHHAALSLEPVNLFNVDDRMLYALFRRDVDGRREMGMFRTSSPLGPWRYVPTTVSEGDAASLEGHSTSPGLWFDDRLWLIGGSRIDPDITSNHVWSFSYETGEWIRHDDAPWEARMGHGVLAYDNQIWVMGGSDENGNPLNDVWMRRDGGWIQQEPDAVPWSPRCLFGTVVHAGRIWLFGGTADPSSDTHFRDLFICTDGVWRQLEMTQSIAPPPHRDPFAVGLGSLNEALILLGKTRTIHPEDGSELIASFGFSLEDERMKTWERFPVDRLRKWGGTSPFSYQLVTFRDRMLVSLALGCGRPNRTMKVFVSG